MAEMAQKKLVVVGDGYVGKTCLLMVYSEGQFRSDFASTVFDNFRVDVNVAGKKVQLSLWDTAGSEDYDRLRPLSYPDSDVILICFSFDEPNSLENVITKWVPEVRHFCPRVPIILVGAKSDLKDDPKVLQRFKVAKTVPFDNEVVHAMADRMGAYAYLECSAKKSEGVGDVFRAAATAASEKRVYGSKKSCLIL